MPKYEVTMHAIDRTVERLNVPRENVVNYLNQLMNTAVQVEHTGTGLAFEHPKTKTRLIIDAKKDLIVTIYPYERDERVPVMAHISDHYLLESLKNAFNERYRALSRYLNELEISRAKKMLEQTEVKSKLFTIVTEEALKTARKDYARITDELSFINKEISLLASKIQRMINEVEKVTSSKMNTPFTDIKENA